MYSLAKLKICICKIIP